MFDVKAIRDDPAAYDRGWASRGLAPQTPAILEADRRLRAAQTAFQVAQQRRNDASRLIGAAKKAGDETRADQLMGEVEALKDELAEHTEAEGEAAAALRELLCTLPNLPAADVPEGPDEHANVELRRWGQPRPAAGARDHVALGEALGLMDFEAAARMSGARFVVLKGQLARLERALGQFMIDLQTGEHGYTEVSPPLLVRDRALFGTAQLPKFEEDLFRTSSHEWKRVLDEQITAVGVGSDGVESMRAALMQASEDTRPRHYLIPTAEVSLTNLVRESVTAEETLPLRLTALTPCFRSEAGASGRDTRGMIRQHQFTKCELVSVTTPEQSAEEHERMTGCAEAVLKRLELPFRTMILCTGDMGFSARRTYDLEVWLPSQDSYREISSCSNCGDFQARRMDARIKKAGEKGTRFPHTLNGSGLAVGRTLVAVLEAYQDDGDRIAVPAALQPYMGGLMHIGGAA